MDQKPPSASHAPRESRKKRHLLALALPLPFASRTVSNCPDQSSEKREHAESCMRHCPRTTLHDDDPRACKKLKMSPFPRIVSSWADIFLSLDPWVPRLRPRQCSAMLHLVRLIRSSSVRRAYIRPGSIASNRASVLLARRVYRHILDSHAVLHRVMSATSRSHATPSSTILFAHVRVARQSIRKRFSK